MAVVHVLRGAPVGCIVTDCLGVFRKCEAIRDGWINREHLQKGTNADLWMLVWEALRADPSWTFELVASHQSEGEAAASGIEPDTWKGNDLADKAAKAQAKAADVPPQVLAEWAEQKAATMRCGP